MKIYRYRSGADQAFGEISSFSELMDSDYFSVCSGDCLPLLPDALSILLTNTAKTVVLVRPDEAPVGTARVDEAVSSFATRWGSAKHLIRYETELNGQLCFVVLSEAMAPCADLLPIEVIHTRGTLPRAGRPFPGTVIVPHFGKETHLSCAIAGLSAAAEVIVCYDGYEVPAHRRKDVADGVAVWAVSPQGGPYVIRDHFANKTSFSLIAFQDSDDLSTPSRLPVLEKELNSGAEMVGSHELRVDELRGEVVAVRYPLDVNASLSERARNALLFPTCAMTSGFYRRTGGLSTNISFALDTQFILRASRLGVLRNVDEFLYIRRLREGSLTTDSTTGMSNPLRTQLDQDWKADFLDVLADRQSLESSRLGVGRSGVRYSFSKIA